MRHASDRPTRNGGYLHFLRSTMRSPLNHLEVSARPEKPPPDFMRMQREFRERVFQVPAHVERLAKDLGLPLFTLHHLGIGWSEKHRAFVFPMKNADGQVIGLHLRTLSGRKISIKGSRLGLFVPNGLKAGGRLYLPEGMSDTAALLSLRLPAVGRPSCNTGNEHVIDLARQHGTKEAVVVADRDGPGQQGAKALADALKYVVPVVKIFTPPEPHKDVRAWIAGTEERKEVSHVRPS